MNGDQPDHHSNLFTLRPWSESLGHDRIEWRGKVQHVPSGEARYIRDWPALLALLLTLVPDTTAYPTYTEGDDRAEDETSNSSYSAALGETP